MYVSSETRDENKQKQEKEKPREEEKKKKRKKKCRSNDDNDQSKYMSKLFFSHFLRADDFVLNGRRGRSKQNKRQNGSGKH